MWGTRFLLLISSLTFFGSTATGPPDGDFIVHTIAVGQGDAHVIECNTPKKRDFAIVDMGTSSIKDARTVDRIKKIVGNSVSNIFLTHPDEDHYNYLKNFQDKKNVHFHLGGDLALWGEGTNSKRTAADIIAPLIYDQSVLANKKNGQENRGYSVYMGTDFFEIVKNKRVRKSSIDVDLCNKKMKMEILLGGHTKSNVNDKNGASLVMRLSGPGLKSMLFMGDFFESNGIDYLLSDEFKIKNNLKADVWLLPHHGAEMYNLKDNSKESQIKYKKLADAVGAKKIVISSNIKGSYAHPKCVTLKNLFYNSNKNGQCATKPPPPNDPTKDYVQCWSEVPQQERLYRPEFCQWSKDVNINDVKIYQTTREDLAGNVIWKDVETDLKTGNVRWIDIQN